MFFDGLNTYAHVHTPHACRRTHTNPINSLKGETRTIPIYVYSGTGVYISQCVGCAMKLPGFGPQHCIKTDVVAHACNPSTREVEAGGWQVEGHSQLQSVHGHAGIYERFWQ